MKRDDKMAEKNQNTNSENCTHNCSSCGVNCPSRSAESRESLLAPTNKLSKVKKVIGVISGKGGVGKSLVTSMMAINMNRRGHTTAILDADITGPSIPKIFAAKADVEGSENGMFPVQSTTGIRIMSVNLLLEDESAPVVWRGPVIAGVIKQFWSDVVWGDVDFMFVDMPPGTGDVALTVFQSLPVDGIIIVTSPQELVSMIVKKAVKMAEMMKVPIIGLVENMGSVICPDCNKRISIFGESKLDEISEELNLDVLGRIPLDPKLAALCDKGMLELMENDYLDTAAQILENRFKM